MILPSHATSGLAVTLFDWASLLFGGSGVAALGWLLNFSVRRRRLKSKHGRAVPWIPQAKREENPPERAASETAPTTLQVHAGPRPGTIHRAIEAAPPFSRDLIASNFIGTRVDWTLEFRQLLLSSDRKIATVRLDGDPKSGFPIVECVVALEDFAFLKVIHEGSLLRVSGAISKASHYEIFVGPPNFSMLPVQTRLVRGD
jgi:hypothetical protein